MVPPRGPEEGLMLSRCAVPTHAEALEDGRPRVPRRGALGRHSAVLLFPDVDECAAEPPPCQDTQYCENTHGSFVCEGERRPCLPAPPALSSRPHLVPGPSSRPASSPDLCSWSA